MSEKGKPMTKAQLISTLSEKLGMTQKDVKHFLSTFNEIIYKETKKNGGFSIPGLGKFVLLKRKAWKGRNPLTGETVTVPAKNVVKFRVSKTCKDAIAPSKPK